jgi:TonB family protein
MAFFLDTQETTQRFRSQIAEFSSLLDTNHIPHGTPEDLFEFARVLENSNQFRNDLSALVKSVVKKESGELLLTDMMSIIATSVGGPSVTDTRADITNPTNILMEFLLGTGCWKQFGSPPPPSPRSAAAPLRPPVRTEEPPPIQMAGDAPRSRANLRDVSSELRQTLTRLEISTLQVKQHLDSIEQQIGKIEPPPDALPPERPLPPSSLHRTVDTAADEVAPSPAGAIPLFETGSSARGRAMFSQPDPVEEENDFSSPTFAYGSERRKNFVPAVVFLILLAVGAAAFYFVHTGKAQAFWKEGISRFGTVRAPSGNAPAPVSHESGAASSTNPAPASASTGTSTGSAPSGASATVPETGSNKASTPSTPTDNSHNGASANTQPVPDKSQLKYVQSKVMEGRLLSAPRPEYPPFARTNHIQGLVTLQATISKAGSVEALHATRGPQPLRGAAVDAVRNWRYRPYTINGQPVEVATTVYVRFSLSPPPAMAR